VITFVSILTQYAIIECKQISGGKYNVGAANLDMMNETLQSVDWNSTLSSLDVNDAWVCFKVIYQDAINKICVPVYKTKQKKNLWMNSDALQIKKSKNKLWKRYSTAGCTSNLLKYKAVNNKLRQLTRNLRRIYEMNLTINIESKPKAFWNSRVKICPTIEELCKSDGTTTSLHPEMVTIIFPASLLPKMILFQYLKLIVPIQSLIH